MHHSLYLTCHPPQPQHPPPHPHPPRPRWLRTMLAADDSSKACCRSRHSWPVHDTAHSPPVHLCRWYMRRRRHERSRQVRWQGLGRHKADNSPPEIEKSVATTDGKKILQCGASVSPELPTNHILKNNHNLSGTINEFQEYIMEFHVHIILPCRNWVCNETVHSLIKSMNKSSFFCFITQNRQFVPDHDVMKRLCYWTLVSFITFSFSQILTRKLYTIYDAIYWWLTAVLH